MEQNHKTDLKYFLVGGAVRDMLLHRPSKDRDFVVIGETPESMIARGFSQVGKDFPVFLEPDTGCEYALARVEKSTGPAHTNFTFSTDNVTLEQDLRRRDLTINAIAMDRAGNLIDPHGGATDLKKEILRHVDDSGFVEDPLRVLRLARFCARYPRFTVDSGTITLCKKMVVDGMLNHLTPERVSGELIKAMAEIQPSRFFYFLQMIGGLKVILPEVSNLADIPAGSFLHHPEGSTFVHTMMVVDGASVQTSNLSGDDRARVIWAALVHDLGKGTTPTDLLPKHHGHEERGVPLVEQIVDRLKMPSAFGLIGKLVCRYHTHVHNTFKLNPKTFVKIWEQGLKSGSHLQINSILTTVSFCDARGRTSFYGSVEYPNRYVFGAVIQAIESVKARDFVPEDQLNNVELIKNTLYKQRVAAAKSVLDQFRS